MKRTLLGIFRRSRHAHRKSRQNILSRPGLETLESRLVPANLPPGFAETRIATGLVAPSAMSFAPDGRLFVAEQAGRLRIVRDGALLPTPFVTVSTTSAGERGLLGIAFDPYDTVGYVYVYYTVPTAPIHNRISRFTPDPADPDRALPGSEQVILELNNLSSATNHNGGAIHFSAWDGMLYVAVGENANGNNAQNLGNLLGKILRINAANYPDLIPTDNPYYGVPGVRQEIYANGFRNPFTFAINNDTGQILVNDVGSSGSLRREEVNDLYWAPDMSGAGGNYGWPVREGYTDGDPLYTSPIFAYGPGYGGPNCAIIGAAFEPQGGNFPEEYWGQYFFGDLCGGFIQRLDPTVERPRDTVQGFATDINPSPGNYDLADVEISPFDGTLYYLERARGGSLFQVYYDSGAGTLSSGLKAPPSGVAFVALEARADSQQPRLTLVTPVTGSLAFEAHSSPAVAVDQLLATQQAQILPDTAAAALHHSSLPREDWGVDFLRETVL